MKVSITRALNYFDIGMDYRITLGALFRVLQEASGRHSDDAENAMTATGKRWILHRIAAQIDRLPMYAETVTATTWHRFSRGFKAYREYELYAGGDRVAAATTIWLYYDLDAGRLRKVPKDTGEKYGVVDECATDFDLEAWKPENDIASQYTTLITTRPTDFDPLNHVNNAVYFDYLLALLCRNGFDPGKIRTVSMQYDRQIGKDVASLEAACETKSAADGDAGIFKMYNDGTVFATGEWTERSTS